MNINNVEKNEKIANIAVSIVTMFAIVIGGVFGLVQYFDYKEEIRVKNSLAILDRYHNDEVLKSNIKVYSAWSENYENLMKLIKEDPSAEAYEGFILALVEKKDLPIEINTIFNLYDETVVCVYSNLCDKDTIDNYFRESARSFFHRFYPVVCNQRKRWNDPTIWSRVEKFYNPESIGKICS